jgi:VacB/RNase II family 3'-5' exoribonuclease
MPTSFDLNPRIRMSSMNELQSIAYRAMVERGFEPDFSPAVLAQTEAITRRPDDVTTNVRDLRELPWLSIDNDDSRDLDQLSVALPLTNGVLRILVAIADVDALVPKGSAIDEHAYRNTTSVYTAARIFSMLPEKLSTDLTSLNEHEERLAIVADMTIGTDGAIVASDVYRASVVSQAKLAYNSVSDWLDGKAAAPAAIASATELQEQIRVQDAAAQRMRSLRYAHGAMNFDTIQAEPVFVDGALRDLRAARKGRAKELIEDLMIGANTVTARFLEDRKVPSIRRVLRVPRRWDRIVALAVEVGDSLPPAPDAVALSEFLNRRRTQDPAHYADLSLAVIKMLGSGDYGVDVPGEPAEGHFGLAVNDYAHSTAPNRRFPDLVTQRLLKSVLANAPAAYNVDELRSIAEHCTVQEDNAAKVERQVRKSAAAMLLQSRLGQQFDAIVTGASAKGTWVRISTPIAEGRVVKGANGLDVGDRVRVQLVHTDIDKGFIDFVRS